MSLIVVPAAFTRTLTIIYSTTLLSLLTHIQLALVGRSKYVQSVIDLQQDEKLRDYQGFGGLMSSLFVNYFGEDQDSEILPAARSLQAVNEYTEKKFLTLSWWLLHTGWKDVGERVRRSVEEVFDEYVVVFSLLTKANCHWGQKRVSQV